MVDLGSELLPVAKADVVGLAFIDAGRAVQRKIGQMVDWLPEAGTDCCECMLLAGMESEFTALAEGQREVIALPGVRGALPRQEYPVTAIVLWNEDGQHYVVVAMPDFTALQVETLIGSERHARRLMEQQLEAASSEARFASLARTRLRLARDLHDTLVHSLMALLTQIRLVQHFASSDPDRLSEGIETAEEVATKGLERARDAIARLRMPDGLDSMPDVETMLSDFAEQTGAEVSVHIDDDARDGLDNHGTTVQRILGEALRNIETHAGAQRVGFRATEKETASGRQLVVEISDDGQGFDRAEPRPGHFGLAGMAEFAELVGGACTVESSPGQGTLIRVCLPTGALSPDARAGARPGGMESPE